MNYKMSLILILSGLVALFIIQNAAVVEIQFLFWATQMPRSLLMFLLLSVGGSVAPVSGSGSVGGGSAAPLFLTLTVILSHMCLSGSSTKK